MYTTYFDQKRSQMSITETFNVTFYTFNKAFSVHAASKNCFSNTRVERAFFSLHKI